MLNTEISQQQVNPQALEVCHVLQNEGYQAFIVGGCVRDLLLGVTPKDWDITTDATPEQIMGLFPKTIPTGLQHGTVTVVMGEGVANHFEVTTFRIEGKYSDGRRPEEVQFVMNVEQDLARRDLTINAIAFDPITNRLVDPFDGIQDLNLQVVRAVGDAYDRFTEDGLRIMRAARFAARFGYTVNGLTLAAMSNTLGTLRKVSKERIQDELCKTLMTDNPSYGMQILEQSGALKVACPFLASEPPYLHFISTLDKCKGELETRLAYLYGNVKTPNAKEELISLKFANKQIKRTVFLLDLLDKYGEFSKWDNKTAYATFMAHIKNQAPEAWDQSLEQFLILTEAMGFESRAMLDKYKEVVVFSKREMMINGDDLISLGIDYGPCIKGVLDGCYSMILKYPEYNTLEHLKNVALNEYDFLVKYS